MNSISDAELTILYGSQTGNAEFLAYNLCEQAQQAGIQAEFLTLNDALAAGNLSWQRLLIVTSTHDNGHMPDNADAFWSWLTSLDDRQYAGLPYAVLTIGDSMYDDFCKAGRDFDAAFANLGATPILDMMECDVDFDMTAPPWIKKFLAAVPDTPSWSPGASEHIDTDTAGEFVAEAEEWHSAHVSAIRALSGPASNKSAFHLTLELPISFTYVPGDSLDTRALNNRVLIDEWLRAFPGEETVSLNGETVRLWDALRSHLELRIPHVGLVNTLASRAQASAGVELARRMVESGDRQEIDAWLWGRDVLDIVHEFGLAGSELQPIVDAMRPLQFRSYSIASSPRVHPSTVGLTISSVEYAANGREHFGTGSSHLEALVGSQVSVRRVPARSFRLPDTPDTPVIMIGPGVGVAPFIGFLEDIEAHGSARDTWLFFGDQHRASDWLYESQMKAWLDSGVLTRLNLAFSRDQAEKQYVQHELLTHASEIRDWIARGAHVYVCGDKNHMAHDVEQTLAHILTGDEADVAAGAGAASLEALRTAGRYVKDVY
ncbi:assimilatory sulfite reductase (NADPH) flavoprotein subunit [Leucobacter komagatae]